MGDGYGGQRICYRTEEMSKGERDRIIKKNKAGRIKKRRNRKWKTMRAAEEKEDKELQACMIPLFKCPIYDVAMAKIYQCIDGHILHMKTIQNFRWC